MDNKDNMNGKKDVPNKINTYIEHTLLKPETTISQIKKLCLEGIEHQFHGVCVNSRFVLNCRQFLGSSMVKIVTVVGFPLGASSSQSKAFETKIAINDGADEIDMVLAIGALKDCDYDYVLNDIKAVVAEAKNVPVKVIIETALLTDTEKIKACQLTVDAGARFVKTCSGFSGGGASPQDIALMRKTVGDSCGIKASGGIKTLAIAQSLISAGANRLGTSSGVELINGLDAGNSY